MSTLITTTTGQAQALARYRLYLNTLVAGATLKVRLFRNNYTPVAATTIANLTEANFTGYAIQEPTNPFGAVWTNGDGKAEIDCPDVISFTATGNDPANSIYGYFVWDTAASEILWVERFDAPIVISQTGHAVNLVLRFTAKSEF